MMMWNSTPKEPNPAVWQSETAFPDLTQTLKEGLRAVKDPEIGLDIIQLGLVRNVIIEQTSAIITMILTTPFCPYGPTMLEDTRQKAEELLNRPVSMDFRMETWDSSMMEPGAAENLGFF
ncbi:MAG TPA: iron-sulfur cluster assembly protein [Anaerolineaceae bacterium]|nr:iron-sulfur cluster assembly protein [Anaerolineaceae bacterium]HPN53598.1 iron-sulfur cluster assembly protein [Anaerolineaceae bacterium]